MQTGRITFGAGSNLDVDDMTVSDGMSVAFYNCYIDRLGNIRRFPGLTKEHDLNTGMPVYAYYSVKKDVLVLV